MNITDIRIHKVPKDGKIKAFVSITIDGVFVVHDIKIIEGEKGMFLSMPSHKTAEGEYRDIAHPITTEYRQSLQNMIFAKYEEFLKEEAKSSKAQSGGKPEKTTE
ncbi:MAG: septation regulator SpoVG [Lachnospiraceae bacterium]|nr:septation regulator SpoVG [Lachnospiraceae bacterium]